MSSQNEHIIYGEKEEYFIQYDCLGKYLMDCLKNRKPGDILVLDGETNESITCGELLEKSIKLAIALKALSLKKGDVAAISSENNLSYCIPLLALLYLGVTVNTINYEYTIGELNHTFGLSKPKAVFCSAASLQNILKKKKECNYIESVILIKSVERIHDDVIIMEDLIKNVISNIDDFDVEKVELSSLAVLVSSSGTTGLPKCVGLSHENLMPTMNAFRDPRLLNIWNDITINVLPFFHLYGLFILLSSIFCSLKIIILPKLKTDTYLHLIQAHNCTVLFVVPALLQYFLQNSNITENSLSSVKSIMVGAAMLGKNIYQEALTKFRHIKITQMYGATEASGICTVQRQNYKMNTVGSLIPNATAKVVNPKTNKILGPFEHGEVCVKGNLIMTGYYNNLIETNNSFDGDGFYRTGDLGYYDEQGNFFILDRLKELIKYKGFQVAPTELENLILTHDKIKDCCVIGIPDEKAGEIPLAYIVPKPGVDVTADEIMKFVSENISVQKHLYGGVKFISAIPRSASGKILRRKLQELHKEAP